MIFKFKVIINTDKPNKILGMFGDCIKLRLYSDSDISKFLAKELGCEQEKIFIKSQDIKKKVFEVDLPDPAYEIIMSHVN